jgi:hypothetical protein
MERYRVWLALPETTAPEWFEFQSENTPLLGEIVEAEGHRVRLIGHKSGAPKNYTGKIVGRADLEESY